ncbi:MAG TPA: hypothetical protein VIW64_06085, partial [Pyrinomonadaceae bacterium]
MKSIYVLTFIALAILPISARVQEPTFTVGEHVEYKDKSWPTEVWKEGTVVKVMPEYHQVLIRWDPRDDYPSYTHNGVSIYEQAYNMDSVRPIKAKSENKPQANGAGTNAARNGGNETKPVDDHAANIGAGGGLMSKQEILGYMKTHGYANGQPKHDLQVCRDLIEMMKKRGVQEPLRAGTDDLSPINDNGCAGGLNT